MIQALILVLPHYSDVRLLNINEYIVLAYIVLYSELLQESIP